MCVIDTLCVCKFAAIGETYCLVLSIVCDCVCKVAAKSIQSHLVQSRKQLPHAIRRSNGIARLTAAVLYLRLLQTSSAIQLQRAKQLDLTSVNLKAAANSYNDTTQNPEQLDW